MKAITVENEGSAPALRHNAPEPAPGPDEVLVRVQASSVNPLDGGIARGFFKARFPHEYPITLGRDFAGVVEQVGDGVDAFAVGDEVFGEIPGMAPLVQKGAWAELVVSSADTLTRKPANVDTATAGAAPLVAITAIQAIDALELSAGDVVLVLGATGGVGSVVVQLARTAGATVIAPARPDDEEFLRRLGVTELVARDGNVVAAVRERYPDGVDALVDVITPRTATPYDAALKHGGRVSSATNAAGEGPNRTNVIHAPSAEILARVAQYLERGTIAIPIHRTYELAQTAEALNAIATAPKRGKLALAVA